MISQRPLQRLAPKPQDAYAAAVSGWATCSRCAPARRRPEQIHASLHHLRVERHLAWSAWNHVACGLKFFSTTTLGWDALHRTLPPRTGRAQRPRVLRLEAWQRLCTSARNPKHRAVLMPTAAAGWRVSEVVPLQRTDRESLRMLSRVEQGKGRTDRSPLLSTRLLGALRASWKRSRPPLWVFPGQEPTRPLPIGTAHKMDSQAKRGAGMQRGQGMHPLRHGFATSLLAAGVASRTIQRLRGPRSIATPTRSLQITRQPLAGSRSPLALLRVADLPPIVSA